MLNNLGLVLKSQNNFRGALDAYLTALESRKNLLGEAHTDTIVSMHNLAECYLAMGNEEESKKLQENMVRIAEEHGILDKDALPSESVGLVGSSHSSDNSDSSDNNSGVGSNGKKSGGGGISNGREEDAAGSSSRFDPQ